MTSRSEVWVSENDTTLLSTRPASLAAAMTSTSRSVAALPLRETTQIAPAGRIRVRRSASAASSAVESAARKTRSVSGAGRPIGHVGRPLGEQLPERAVRVDVADERDARAGPHAELVEERRRVGPLHRRYCRSVPDLPLLVFGPRSTDLRLRPEPPADAAPVRARRSTCCGWSGRSRAWRRSRRRTRSCSPATPPATSQVVKRFSEADLDPWGESEAGIGPGDDPPFHGMHEAAAVGRRRVAPGDGRDPARRRPARVPPGRRPPPRDAVARRRVLHLQRRRAGDRPGPHGGAARHVHRPRRPPRRRRRGDPRRRPGRADGLDPRERPLPVPGHGVRLGGRRGRGGRDPSSTSRSSRARARSPGSAPSRRCCPSWPRRSGPTSS